MIYQFFYDLLHILPLSLVTVLSFNFAFNKIVQIVIAVICSLFTLFLYYQKPRIRWLIIGPLAILKTSLYLFNVYVRYITLIVEILFICVISVLIEKTIQRQKIIRSLTLILPVTYLCIMLFNRYKVDKTAVLMAFFYILIIMIETVQVHWKKEGDTSIDKHVIYLAPFLALTIFLMYGIKVPDKPFDWTFVKDSIHQLQIRLESISENFGLINGQKRDVFYTGFSDISKIGGSLDIDSYKALTIFSDVYSDEMFDLDGMTFDHFEDFEWTKTDDSELDYKTLDLIETTAAITAYDEENLTDHLRNAYLDIQCTGIMTRHVFTPIKSLAHPDGITAIQKGGDTLFDDSNNENYKIRFYKLNLNEEELSKLIKEKRKLSDEELEAAARKISKQIEYSKDEFIQYRKQIKEIYGQRAEISQRLKDYLVELTKDANNDYEKLLCIEKLLSSMKYDLKPGELPDNIKTEADYLDYLIFESQKGYCVHYATAFVLLARAEGLPARYVQGYRFPMKIGRAEVRSQNAHAWPEVYFEDFGWIEFEPTPGMAHREAQETETQNHPETVKPEEVTKPENNEEKQTKLYIPILLTIGFVVVFVLIDRHIRKVKIDRMSNKDKIAILFKRIMRLLRMMGSGINESETLSEFSSRIKDKNKENISECLMIYEETIYGNREVSDNDVELFRLCNDRLRREYLSYLIDKLTRKRRR